MKDFIKSPFKKKDKQPTNEITANEFMNVKNIISNVLYIKDGYIFSYFSVQPISLELMSEKEKHLFVNRITEQLSSEMKPFKLFIISRPVDISYIIHEQSLDYQNTDNIARKRLIRSNIVTLNEFAFIDEVIERQYFFIIWEKHSDDGLVELEKRARELQTKLADGGIKNERLGEREIIKLCNLFTNLAYAHIEDENYIDAIPFLEFGE